MMKRGGIRMYLLAKNKLQKFSESLLVTLPRTFVQNEELKKGDFVEVWLDSKKKHLIIKKAEVDNAGQQVPNQG